MGEGRVITLCFGCGIECILKSVQCALISDWSGWYDESSRRQLIIVGLAVGGVLLLVIIGIVVGVYCAKSE